MIVCKSRKMKMPKVVHTDSNAKWRALQQRKVSPIPPRVHFVIDQTESALWQVLIYKLIH
jgi:hypothetical protein